MNNKNMPRSKRLSAIYNQAVSFAAEDDVVVDVGADHGYLAVILKQSNMFKHVIATDISAPSLNKTEELAKSLNLNIETRVGDGLTVAQDATIACICGMGGYEIIKILQQQKTVQKFVLQPVQKAIELRVYLLKNKYKIVSDTVVEDKDKCYYIMSVNGKGKNRYSKTEMLFGKEDLNNPTKDFKLYLQNQINKLQFVKDINLNKIELKQRKEVRQKVKHYKLCKKILNKIGSAV